MFYMIFFRINLSIWIFLKIIVFLCVYLHKNNDKQKMFVMGSRMVNMRFSAIDIQIYPD
jgi:hypothetical protein